MSETQGENYGSVFFAGLVLCIIFAAMVYAIG
jgi:hypothetical protein